MFATDYIVEDPDASGIVITGNNNTIVGDIHSNGKIALQKKTQIDGTATAVALSNKSTYSNGSVEKGDFVDPPTINSFDDYLGKVAVTISDSTLSYYGYNLTGDTIQELIGSSSEAVTLYLNTTQSITISCKSFSCPVNIITNGPVTVQGNTTVSSDKAIVIMTTSSSGFVFNGSGLDFYGILFAPKGNVTIHGQGAKYHGSIIAQNITIDGGKVQAVYTDDAGSNFPDTKVRLIN
jgi:cytoskeletal protein CcmA (bactofilin family)